MSEADGQRERSGSIVARVLWLLFWFLRNAVVFLFLAYPAAIALFVLVEASAVKYSYRPHIPVVGAVVEGTPFMWALTLPSALPIAAAFSAIVVGLSLALSGKWLRLAATVLLVLMGVWVVLYAFVPQTGWSLSSVAQACVSLACLAAYGWFCAIPPRAMGARARWEAVIANGALMVSLAVPITIVLLLTVFLVIDLLSR